MNKISNIEAIVLPASFMMRHANTICSCKIDLKEIVLNVILDNLLGFHHKNSNSRKERAPQRRNKSKSYANALRRVD